jgi:hypothetical protein
MIINQIAIPNKLNLFGKTLGNSAFGYLSYGVWDYKHFTLFKVNVQGVGNSFAKRDIDGSQVGMFFMSIRILIELLLIVKRTPLPLLKFFSSERRFIDRRRNYSCLNKIWAVKF